MFLYKDELKILSGLKRPSAQINWLRQNGFDFTIRADGAPVVSRMAVEKRLGGQTENKTQQSFDPNWEPGWSLLDAS